MKKILYIALIAFSASLTFVSCTEEEVTPTTQADNGGGGASDPKGK